MAWKRVRKRGTGPDGFHVFGRYSAAILLWADQSYVLEQIVAFPVDVSIIVDWPFCGGSGQTVSEG